MKTWEVTLPVTGIARMVVEAETEEQAIQEAMMDMTIDDLEEWEPVEKISEGNVLYAMRPWEAEAVEQ